MAELFHMNYLAREIFPIRFPAERSIARYIRMTKAQKERFRLIRGHVTFSIESHLPNEGEFFTIMRDPVRRAVSEFMYISRSKHIPLSRAFRRHDLSYGEALRQGLLTANLQTRFLAGVDTPYHRREDDSQILDRAIYNLRRCRVVGLQERFSESIGLCAGAFGWDKIAIPNANRNVLVPDPSLVDEIRMEIERFGSADQVLYDEAVKIFNRQLREEGDRVQRIVNRARTEPDQWFFRSFRILLRKAYFKVRGY